MTEEEFPSTETVQELMQGTHTLYREDQFGLERGIGSTQLLQIWVTTALCPDASRSRKFPVQTAASTGHPSFLPPTRALQQVSIF